MKIVTLTIILTCLLVVSAVSAAENATEDIVSIEDSNDEFVSVEKATQDVKFVDLEEDGGTLSQSSDSELVSSNESEKISVKINVDNVSNHPSTSFTVPIGITHDNNSVSGVSVNVNLIDSQFGEEYGYGDIRDFNITDFYVTDENGEIYFDVDRLSVGTYILTVSVVDDRYEADDVSVNVVIQKEEVILVCNVENDDKGKYMDIYLKNNEGIPIAMVSIFVKIQSQNYLMKTNSSGQVRVYLYARGTDNEDYDDDEFSNNVYTRNLAPGTYSVMITFRGNGWYEPASQTFDIVLPANSSVTVDDVNTTWDNEITLTAKVMSGNETVDEGIVSFYIDDIFIGNASVINGTAILTYEAPGDAGYHTLSVVYGGTSFYKSSNQSITFNVVSGPQPIDEKDITVPTFPSSSTGTVTVKLPSDATGTVTLSIGGKNYNFDVVNGVANIKVPDLANGEYTYSITYSGDDKYSSFTKTGKVTVNKPALKPAIKTTLALKKVKVKRSAKKLTIQATLKINGKAVKSKIIKFKFNKKAYKAKTNAKGVAKITVKKSILKKLKKGKKVTYTATYGKITKKVTVKVKK